MSLPIQTSDPQTRLTKRYATVGRMDLRVDELVVPVVILDDVRETGEARAGVARGFIRQDITATTQPTIEFRLPASPTAIVAQTSRITMGHDGDARGATQNVDIWVAQPNGVLPTPAAAQRNWRDQGNVGPQIGSFPTGGVGERKPTIEVGADLVSDVNLANLGPADYTIVIGGGTRQQTYPLEVTMIPGGSIFVVGLNFADGVGLFVSLDFVEQPRRA